MSAAARMVGPGAAAALLSAFTQAVAHALLKAGRDKLMVRGLIAATCAAVVAPLALFVPMPMGWLWGWLGISSALHVVYQLVPGATHMDICLKHGAWLEPMVDANIARAG